MTNQTDMEVPFPPRFVLQEKPKHVTWLPSFRKAKSGVEVVSMPDGSQRPVSWSVISDSHPRAMLINSTVSPADAQSILFVGRKERYKGYDALRAAAPLVWETHPAARFRLIGQRRFRGPGPLVDERWTEPGVVSETAKAEAYARSTLFCMPSSHETFGHTYLEAWCAGRPVIAGDIAPLREVVREGIDGLHAANEPRAVAAAIRTLLDDPAAAARMGAAGRARVAERWTWDRIAERTEAAYACAMTFLH